MREVCIKCNQCKHKFIFRENEMNSFDHLKTEMYINFILKRLREQLSEMESLVEQEKLLFEVIKVLNERQEKEMHASYKTLSAEEKKEFIKECIDDGIYIHQQPHMMVDIKSLLDLVGDVIETCPLCDGRERIS